MRVATLGHAGLYVETVDQRLLVDPVFAETLLDGILEYRPRRRLALERMPEPTALVVTHAHFDHFHPGSLERIPKRIPVVVPEDAVLIEGLRRLGFTDLRICAPWAAVRLGETRIVATPSGHDEPEMGTVVADASGVFWHMADAEVSPADGARVLREHGAVAVVSAKYQPVVRASMGHLRTRGARFDPAEVVEWLETACAVEPALVFPYASGLAFAGRHAWFNRYAFPLSAPEVTDLLERRLGRGRAATLEPGDAIDVAPGGRPAHVRQVLPFVQALPDDPAVWEPVDLATLAGLDDGADRARLAAELDRRLDGPIADWVAGELDAGRGPFAPLRARGVVWQLVVEAGGGERIERFVEFGRAPLAVGRGRHPRAVSYTHVSGRGLLDVLDGKTNPIVFWLAGDARSYEKVIVVEGGRLVAPPLPPPEDEIGDPLTYFLRYGAARAEPGAEHASPAPAAVAGELDVLARAETRAVLEKKALLSILAEEEAARLAIPLTEADLQATSDAFRAAFGLHAEDDTRRWMRDAGLSEDGYAAVMRRFTAVRLVQERRAAAIEAIVDDHAKVASARALAPR